MEHRENPAFEILVDAIKSKKEEIDRLTQRLKMIELYTNHPFFVFYMAMVDEYKRHEPEKGDTWQTMDISKLINQLEWISFKYSLNQENDGELVDMANTEAMIYLRRRHSRGL